MLILFFVVCLVGAQKYPACQNQTFSFDNSWISEHLPFTNCSLGQDTVYYTYSFPSDTVFCGPFHIWVQVYNEDTGYESTTRPLTIIDSFGMEHLDQSYTQIGYCFPPPQITFNISRNSFYLGNENSVITLRQLNEFASKNYRLLPLNYNKVEQYSITPGMEPLILVMNTSMKNEVLYKIKGHPKLTAYYVKQTDYWPNDQPTSSASSVFVLNGTGGGIIDSVANWNGAREFSELNFIKMGSANHNHMNAPALMFLMDSSDLEDLHDPQFVWPQGIYDISSGSSITLVDLDTYRKKCRYYTVHFDNISEDLEIIVYSGFPKKNIKEATVIGRYNSSQVSIMVLGCTNTIEVLRGSFRLGVDYVTIWSPGQYMLFLPPTNSTLAVKTEAKVCGNHTRIELSVYQNDDEISVSCKVDWRIVKSAQGSTMKMHKWLRNGDGGREQFNLDLTHNGTFMAGKADGVHWTNVNFGGPMTVEFQTGINPVNIFFRNQENTTFEETTWINNYYWVSVYFLPVDMVEVPWLIIPQNLRMLCRRRLRYKFTCGRRSSKIGQNNEEGRIRHPTEWILFFKDIIRYRLGPITDHDDIDGNFHPDDIYHVGDVYNEYIVSDHCSYARVEALLPGTLQGKCHADVEKTIRSVSDDHVPTESSVENYNI